MLLPKLPLLALRADHVHPAQAVGLHAPFVVGFSSSRDSGFHSEQRSVVSFPSLALSRSSALKS